MTIVALDMETFYSKEYSLSRMKESDYILSDQFETIMCSVKVGDAKSTIHIGEQSVRDRMNEIEATIGWNNVALLNHNSRFDGSILYWLYGYRPAMYLCTLSMARALTHCVTGRSSLAAVAKYLGLGEKGREVVMAQGKRLKDFALHELAKYAEYCINDNELCYKIFKTFQPHFPVSELAVIDMSLRMFIEPRVTLNPSALRAHRTVVRVKKQEIMEKVSHIDPKTFSSTDKFTELLRSLDVEIPMKISPATGQLIPAMAKGDVQFKEMVDDPDQPPLVQALLAARVSAKSTIDETRADTLLGLSELSWPQTVYPVSDPRGLCPIPLKYYGAHTGRFSGDGGYNFQNLRRGSAIKRAITARKGRKIIHRDASQIEARMVAWLAGCEILLSAFRERRDVYSEFASGVYKRPVTKKDKALRFVGKTSILGLGYQTGAAKLKNTLYIGNGGVSVRMTLEETTEIVKYYRSMYRELPALWRAFESIIYMMAADADRVVLRRAGYRYNAPIPPAIEVGHDAIWLPNGMAIPYPNIRQISEGGDYSFVYDGPRHAKTIYGGKMTENVTQALARIVITNIMYRVKAETKFTPVLSTHDSLDYEVPEEDAEWWHSYLHQQFAIVPDWAPGLPLASEGGWGDTLAEAERERPDA